MDDRVEETEPWSPRDRKRFWIAVRVTLIVAAVALYMAVQLFVSWLWSGDWSPG